MSTAVSGGHPYSMYRFFVGFFGVFFATMIWLTATEYICHKYPRICPTYPPILSEFMTYHHRFVTRVTRWVPPVEQGLFTLQGHLNSSRVLVRFVLLDRVFCVVLCRSLFVTFVLFLLVIASTVFRFTCSGYPFGIFKLFLYSKLLC